MVFLFLQTLALSPCHSYNKNKGLHKNLVATCTCNIWLEYATNQINSTWHVCNHKNENHKKGNWGKK